MNKKWWKRIKKLGIGSISTTVIVSATIFFGNIQDPNVKSTRNAAESVEYLFYDLFFKTITGKTQEDSKNSSKISFADSFDPNIIIVDVDESSLARLGNYNEWNRSIHANVVKNLSDGGAAAVGFDILFKTADFGKQKAAKTIRDWNTYLSDNIKPRSKDDVMFIYDSTRRTDTSGNYYYTYHDSLKTSRNLFENIKTSNNYDSLLVDNVKRGGNSIACFMMDESKAYPHESQWLPLSNQARANDLGYSSTFTLSQVDHPEKVEYKDLLDNIFPEMAQAAAHMGSVNVYPDDDGIVRHVSMLYRFPSPELYPNIEPHIYSTMPLMTMLHLMHQDPQNVTIRMGKFIDIGKPFGVYRDSLGELHTTYPHFSYPMFRSLVKEMQSEHNKKRGSDNFIDISTKILAQKNDVGEFSFEIMEGQTMSDKLAKVILKNSKASFLSLKPNETRNFGNAVTLRIDPEDDNRFIFTDMDDDEEGIIITPYIINTLQYFSDQLDTMKNGTQQLLSMDLDIRYDSHRRQWTSSLGFLNNDILQDIREFKLDSLKTLKPGEEIRFGAVKKIPIDQEGRFLINFLGRYNTDVDNRVFQHISYYDVAFGRIDPAFYQGKIFILGSAAPALFDYVVGPHEERYPGVLVQATVLKDIIDNKFIVNLNEHKQQLIVILLALICMAISLSIKSYVSVTLSVLLMGVYTFVAYQYFKDGLYLGVSKQLIAMLLTSISALIIQFYYEHKEKSFINNAFKQYISPELIDQMVDNEITPKLGGEKSNITAYFTDIANFSTFSEEIGDPRKLVNLLNEYLSAMTDTLLHNKGTLDKYEGDAIIAFFGAPMRLENHAQSACDTAVDMQNSLLHLRKKWTSEGNKWPKIVQNMHMRIGINSGDIVTGNMGSVMRKNYTMMGDAVNLASRLESAAKQYGAYIQISEDTESRLEQGTFIYRSLDTIRVIGKNQPVKTFELLDRFGCSNEDQLIKLVCLWEQARDAYLSMDWDRAISLFTQCLAYEPHHPDRDPGSNTTPSHIYITRCERYKQNPPVPEGETWDGVFTATEK